MQQQRYPNNQLATSVIANTKNKTIDKVFGVANS